MHRSLHRPHPWIPVAWLCTLITALYGCSAVGELVYDSAAQLERQRCDRLESAPERQACQEKVRNAARQAESARSKP